uniref:Ice-binding protein n=1 Tax=Mantoniella antarctica TaxID=81844 RepID=A0A7S0SSV1_9CHLO|mmetsp:Transcript_34267/g.86187  ORF Transcript_34267/g.86187 Transcript_34267/m.86187 type:complete len:319 (+) Transcript_34267:39-995(+)
MMSPTFSSTVGLALLAFVAVATPASAVKNFVELGTAEDFAILSKSGVSTVPQSEIRGDVGVSPIAQGALTGFSLTVDSSGTFATSDQVDGELYAADFKSPTPEKLTRAVSDMETAYTDAASRSPADFVNHESGRLGGKTLAPGLYKFTTAVGFDDDCTLMGSATDTWIFQIAEGMSINSDKKIILAGGALAKNVVWAVKGVSSFGARSHFEGIVLGATSATFVTDSSITGRVLVQTAVTLQKTTVTEPTSADEPVSVTETVSGATETISGATEPNSATGPISAEASAEVSAGVPIAEVPAVDAAAEVPRRAGSRRHGL